MKRWRMRENLNFLLLFLLEWATLIQVKHTERGREGEKKNGIIRSAQFIIFHEHMLALAESKICFVTGSQCIEIPVNDELLGQIPRQGGSKTSIVCDWTDEGRKLYKDKQVHSHMSNIFKLPALSHRIFRVIVFR